MLSEILNLSGVTVLNKKQQANVKGGYLCYGRGLNSDGSHGGWETWESNGSDRETANSIASGGGYASFSYDCAHDGLTASWIDSHPDAPAQY